MSKIATLAVATLAVAFLAVAGSQSPSAPTISRPDVEFPPQDMPLSMRLREGVTAQQAAQRLSSAPDSPDTVRALALARDADGILRARDAFRKYATTYPRSDWTWVAVIRAGVSEEALGKPAATKAAYLDQAEHNSNTAAG